MSDVNLKKVDRMALVTFRNSLRLHLDSVKMFSARSYPSAFFLSVISLEELGKTFILSDFLFESSVNGRFNKSKTPELIQFFGDDIEEGFFRRTVYHHRAKQHRFVSVFDDDYKPSNTYLKAIRDGLIDQKKQEALYVGLKRSGDRIQMSSRIVDPSKFSRSYVARQIELVHFSILELIINVAKEFWSTDSTFLDAYLTTRLYIGVKPKWRILKKSRKARLRKIELAA